MDRVQKFVAQHNAAVARLFLSISCLASMTCGLRHCLPSFTPTFHASFQFSMDRVQKFVAQHNAAVFDYHRTAAQIGQPSGSCRDFSLPENEIVELLENHYPPPPSDAGKIPLLKDRIKGDMSELSCEDHPEEESFSAKDLYLLYSQTFFEYKLSPVWLPPEFFPDQSTREVQQL